MIGAAPTDANNGAAAVRRVRWIGVEDAEIAVSRQSPQSFASTANTVDSVASALEQVANSQWTSPLASTHTKPDGGNKVAAAKTYANRVFMERVKAILHHEADPGPSDFARNIPTAATGLRRDDDDALDSRGFGANSISVRMARRVRRTLWESSYSVSGRFVPRANEECTAHEFFTVRNVSMPGGFEENVLQFDLEAIIEVTRCRH